MFFSSRLILRLCSLPYDGWQCHFKSSGTCLLPLTAPKPSSPLPWKWSPGHLEYKRRIFFCCRGFCSQQAGILFLTSAQGAVKTRQRAGACLGLLDIRRNVTGAQRGKQTKLSTLMQDHLSVMRQCTQSIQQCGSRFSYMLQTYRVWNGFEHTSLEEVQCGKVVVL